MCFWNDRWFRFSGRGRYPAQLTLMKPCIECGLAIQNNSKVCAECGRQQAAPSSREDAADHSPCATTVTPRSVVCVLSEVLVRTLIVAMLPACILIGIFYFLVPLKIAIVLGCGTALVVGFGYALLEMYFQNC